MKYKYFFFDMDGTITESRFLIAKEMVDTLHKLPNVLVISGASKSQMIEQIKGLNCHMLAQSGNDTTKWTNKMSKKQSQEVLKHIVDIMHFHGLREKDITKDMIEDRGGQIAFSFLGHHADRELKKIFDPTMSKRKNILSWVPFTSKTIEVKIGGTTCLDYVKKGCTKGDNIKRWIQEQGWEKDECIFFGDGLMEGGNDESVIGVIQTVKVANPKELLGALQDFI